MRLLNSAFIFLLFFIVAGGSPNRTYKAAELLLEGYSTENIVMEPPITERISQTYLYLGVPAESISLLEQEATST